jgi:arginase
LEVIRQHDPARVVTLGGECAVSVAPFSELARRYGEDLAIVWIDSHPDVGTPASEYPGFHAMAVAALTGHGPPEVQQLLPATVSPGRVALVGLHSWAEDDIANVAQWGIRSFSPGDLGGTTQPLLDWLAATGCARVAIHFDVDTIDSNEIVLGLGAEPGGLTSAQVRRIVGDIDAVAEVVGITVAEFIPRQVMHLQQLLTGFPLLGASRSGSAGGRGSQGGDPTVTGATPDQAPTSQEG